MGSQALTAFLIKLALEPEFARQWAKAQPDAKRGGEDPRIAFLDQVKGLDEADKNVLLSGKGTDVELAIGSNQHGIAASNQHGIAHSVMQGPVRITITVETR